MYGIYHRSSQKLDPAVYSSQKSAEIDRRSRGTDAVTVRMTEAMGHTLEMVEPGAPGTQGAIKKGTK